MPAYPEDVQDILQKVRAVIHDTAPEAVEAIKYAIPTFILNGKNLVHFGGFKKHIGFYPAPSGLVQFKEELAMYQGTKGAVQFSLDEPIPYDLIRRITAFRVQAELEKAAEKRKNKISIIPAPVLGRFLRRKRGMMQRMHLTKLYCVRGHAGE